MISNFQDIPTFTSLKSYLLSLIRPKIKSTFAIHDALGLRYICQFRMNLSALRSHKMRHTSAIPLKFASVFLVLKIFAIFYLNALFQRVTLAVNVIDIFQRKNISAWVVNVPGQKCIKKLTIN